MTNLERMKMVLRENDYPFFTDEALEFYLSENKGDVNTAIYQCLCVKAEDTSISLSGLSTNDTSQYFRRLATFYRPSNTGILEVKNV